MKQTPRYDRSHIKVITLLKKFLNKEYNSHKMYCYQNYSRINKARNKFCVESKKGNISILPMTPNPQRVLIKYFKTFPHNFIYGSPSESLLGVIY